MISSFLHLHQIKLHTNLLSTHSSWKPTHATVASDTTASQQKRAPWETVGRIKSDQEFRAAPPPSGTSDVSEGTVGVMGAHIWVMHQEDNGAPPA